MARMDHNLIEAVNNEIKYPPPFLRFLCLFFSRVHL
jgi:hypothetical protein